MLENHAADVEHPTVTEECYSSLIPNALAGRRLDQALAEMFPDFSRARLQRWLKAGLINVDGALRRAKDIVIGGELVEMAVVLEDETHWLAEPMLLEIVYEDDAIIVLNKPPGLVVHPGAGNLHGTLSNGLLHYASELEKLPRAGVVHRLDKDTSGLLVVARNLQAHNKLVQMLQTRNVRREYMAIVQGVMRAGGTVDAPIGRHPSNRLRMAVTDNGKPAVTHYRVANRFRHHTLVDVKLETGRTHQIRVHMAYIQFPLVGDGVYGGRLSIPAGCSPLLADQLRTFKRQALHAVRLGFEHPISGKPLQWEVSPPQDFAALLQMLELDLAT